MIGSELRGKIEDFLWDFEKFQRENTNLKIQYQCNLIVENLEELDTMLSKQEAFDE